jgi:hypothetical protein
MIVVLFSTDGEATHCDIQVPAHHSTNSSAVQCFPALSVVLSTGIL